jgi:hypothetical protein
VSGGAIIGLAHNPWASDLTVPRPHGRGLAYQYRWLVWHKANPRSAAYMAKLFAERFPDGALVDSDVDLTWRRAVADAEQIVLLYPDSIGLGFANIERTVTETKRSSAVVSALTGRRRAFRLDMRTETGLKFRRALEWSMAGEILAAAVFVVLTPPLLAFDWLAGHR